MMGRFKLGKFRAKLSHRWDRFRHREPRSDDGSTTLERTRSEADRLAREDSKRNIKRRRRKPSRSDYKRPLLYYVTYHWPEHVLASEQNTVLDDDLSPVTALLERFLGAPQASNAQNRKWAWVRHLDPVENSILAACEYGFNRILSQWWRIADLDHTLTNSHQQTYMMVAARAGHVAILRLLLQKGGTTGIQGSPYIFSTPLMEAASSGQVEAARTLLREGSADINLQVMKYGPGTCALETALSRHSPNMLSMVHFLVSEGHADVNMQLRHSGYGSVLTQSAALGWLEATKYLVEEGGADVDLVLQHGNHGSALACAVSYGRGHCPRGELLDYLVRIRRANVDLPLQTGRYGSALAAAASKGRMDFVEYLIEFGKADVNMPLQAGYYGSALAAAVAEGHLDCVWYLIKTGKANVNMPLPDFPYGSALTIAAYMANERPKGDFAKAHVRIDIVRVLLEAGALVALDLGNGGTADALEAFNESSNQVMIYDEGISDGNGDDLDYEDHEDLQKSFSRRLVRLRKKLREHSVLPHVRECRDD